MEHDTAPGEYSSRAARTTQSRSSAAITRTPTLARLCRAVIVANLDRYPAEAFGICDEEAWDAIARLRHSSTRPKEGSGGLDGTGRMVPAVSDKFLEAVEEHNPHLAESVTVDELLWKDCVEFRFRRGGLTRPVALTYPWPILVENLKSTASCLNQDDANNNFTDPSSFRNAVITLTKLPMNVSLLRDSGIGKTVKKILKSPHANVDSESCKQLETLLSSWISLAARAGIEMKGQPKKDTAADEVRNEEANDLAIAESCITWRQLFAALKRREEKRRNSQGKRMREIRRNLAATRPKLLSVRPTKMKSTEMACPSGLSSSTGHPGTSGNIFQLRREVQVQSQKLKTVDASRKPSFADAVAFASGTSKGKAHRTQNATTVHLAGNKRMRVPTKIVKGAGPRQLASKWKK